MKTGKNHVQFIFFRKSKILITRLDSGCLSSVVVMNMNNILLNNKISCLFYVLYLFLNFFLFHILFVSLHYKHRFTYCFSFLKETLIP